MEINWLPRIELFSRLQVIINICFQGHSPAGGCLLATCCDYRVMVENFTIGLNETQLVWTLALLINYYQPKFLKWNNPPYIYLELSIYHFRDIKMSIWKLVSHQYRAWSDCIDVQAGLALYWWQRLITFGYGMKNISSFIMLTPIMVLVVSISITGGQWSNDSDIFLSTQESWAWVSHRITTIIPHKNAQMALYLLVKIGDWINIYMKERELDKYELWDTVSLSSWNRCIKTN